jgi:hypothetical protein
MAKHQGMKRSSKLDFFSGYQQHHNNHNSIEMTAVSGPDGLYEWLVVPFGIMNAPSQFMELMIGLLR